MSALKQVGITVGVFAGAWSWMRTQPAPASVPGPSDPANELLPDTDERTGRQERLRALKLDRISLQAFIHRHRNTSRNR